MQFLLSSGEAVLEGRIANELYDVFMESSCACPLEFRRRAISESDLRQAKQHLTRFCKDYYRVVYKDQN